MKAKSFLLAGLVFVLLSLMFVGASGAAQKINFGTPVGRNALYALPSLAAEEKGFWERHGLVVKWVPFTSGGAMHQSVAAGAIDLGMSGTVSLVQAMARGVPEVIVADLKAREDFFVWVGKDSPARKPEDLKGARLGISRTGSVTHALGRVMAKVHGLERDVRFVATGGTVVGAAALKAGAIDGLIATFLTVGTLREKGAMRQMVALRDYLPQPWVDVVIFARRDLATSNPEAVKGGIRAILAATQFVMENEQWSLGKMVAFSGYSPEVAGQLFRETIKYGPGAAIDRKSLENVLRFLMEYGLVAKDKAPVLESLFLPQFAE